MGFEEMQLRNELRTVAGKHPAWGWRKARWHLQEQLAWKQRRTGPGAGEQKRLTAQYPMHVVSFDFQSDVTSCGRHIRFSTNTPAPRWRSSRARSFKAADVVAVLENIIAETGTAPAYVRCDNGPEFTAAAVIAWCNTAVIAWCNTAVIAWCNTAFIDPGPPWQNGFIESFNAQFRREQLSGEIMVTMAEAKYLAEEWKAIYHHQGPTDPWTA